MYAVFRWCFIFWLPLFLICCEQQRDGDLDIQAESRTRENKPPKRYGSVIRIKPEMVEKYRELHAEPWPEISAQIYRNNIRNYSIFLKDDYLFAYFEYIGKDFAADMAAMAMDSMTQEWWKLTDPCQVPLESRKKGEWWASMEEVFHQH
ncbi:MAG: L-rhamnose mutarotase [Saprospiraceae bacterium]|nr:L-rhamnose mutarotase [Saprospiraceae bacterium]